ncbi:MAG: hypothetical protein V7605_1878, partial [Acidimicrobiaceae bacterium]
ADVGSVLVVGSDNTLFGLVTDRDIVLRAVATGMGLDATTLVDMCTEDLATVSPSDSVTDALSVMRDNAVRRVPVVLNDEPVGIMSISDVAVRSGEPVAQELQAALSGITSATRSDPVTPAGPPAGTNLRAVWHVPPMTPVNKGDKA